MQMLDLVYVPLGKSPFIFSMQWSSQMTVADLVAASGILQYYPEVEHLSVGIFAQCVTVDTVVRPGDRVEFYRPLLIDPKEKRRRRAKKRPLG